MSRIARPVVAVDPSPASRPGYDRGAVSVVMVVYKTGEALGESLASVLADPLVTEFVIVDNGSSAAEAAHLAAAAATDPRVVLITGQGNVGFSRGANLGARTAKGEFVLFLNPDAFLQRGCVAELTREVARHPSLCLVGGRVLNADHTEQRGARRGDITLVSALMSLTRLAKAAPSWKRFEVHWEDEEAPRQAAEVPVISGACFCMRAGDFAAMAGFDEGYFLHVEDVDLCWRVRRDGGQVFYHPRAEVVHVGSTSMTSPLKVEFHKGVGLARYFRKRADGVGQTLAAWLLSPLIVCTALARPLIWRLKRVLS